MAYQPASEAYKSSVAINLVLPSPEVVAEVRANAANIPPVTVNGKTLDTVLKEGIDRLFGNSPEDYAPWLDDNFLRLDRLTATYERYAERTRRELERALILAREAKLFGKARNRYGHSTKKYGGRKPLKRETGGLCKIPGLRETVRSIPKPTD